MCIIEDICGYTEKVAYTIFFSLLLGNLGVRRLKVGSSLWLSCVLRDHALLIFHSHAQMPLVNEWPFKDV